MSRLLNHSFVISSLLMVLIYISFSGVVHSAVDNAKFMLTEKETQQTMEKARQAVISKNYGAAIKLYTRVLSRGVMKYRKDAQEFLGVTREKNGQYAHAKAEYEEYLRLYPEGEGAERVRMRLTGMLTALSGPRGKLKKSRRTDKTIWESNGYFTEYLRYDRLRQNEVTSKITSSTSSYGLFTQRRSNSSNLKMEVTGDYTRIIGDSERERRRLTSMFIDYANRPKTFSARIGRQNHVRSGVLGRMDGIWMDYQFHPEWKINYVAGYPVNLIETNAINKRKKLQGVSLDLGTFKKQLDFNIFAIEQTVDGITDREAVGGEAQFTGPKLSWFVFVDYDTYFEELNKYYLVGTLRLDGNKLINVSYDRGKAPYLTTSNALLGQTFSSIAEMRNTYTDEEIKQIARDRTADSTIWTISGSFPLSRKYTASVDMTTYNLSGTPGSAGAQGTDATGNEYFYSARLIGSDVIFKSDTLIAGVRYSDSQSYNRTGFSLNERVEPRKRWRLDIGMYYETEERTNGAQSTAFKPSLGIDFLRSRTVKIVSNIYYTKRKVTGDTLPTTEEDIGIEGGVSIEF